MDSQDQVQNVPPKDESVDPNAAGQQPKTEDTAVPADTVAEDKETTSPADSQSKSEVGTAALDSTDKTPAEPSDQIMDNSKVSSEDKAESDEKPKQEEENVTSESEAPTQDPKSEQVTGDKETAPISDSSSVDTEITDSRPKTEEENEPSEELKQDETPEQVSPIPKKTDAPDAQPKEEISSSESSTQDVVIPSDQATDDSSATIPKESDSLQDTPTLEENVDSQPKEEKDATPVPLQTSIDQVAEKDAPEEAESIQKDSDERPDKEDSIVVIPGDQNQPFTGDEPISNNVDNQVTSPSDLALDNKTVIPATEINGSTITPDKPNDTSTFTIDEDILPKTNGTSQPSSKAKDFCAENWLVVLAICLVILTILATIILAAIIIPILSLKEMRPLRLPGSVIPEHYILEIRPLLIPDHSGFEGSVLITVLCVKPTNKLILHSNGLEIDENSIGIINLKGGHSPFILKTVYDIENEFVIFSLCENLTVGTKYDVHILFKGKFSEDLYGFSMITYEKSGETKHMALTKFDSIYARKAFPCFDEPALKATFDINLVRWKNMTSLSNMKRLATLEREKDWEIDMYQRSVPMSTYLVTFVVGDLERIQTGKVSIWAAKDVDYYQYALNVTSSLLAYYESYLRVPYSISKLDQLAAEKYRATAMENWGVIIYRKYTIKSGTASEKGIARIISHELSHQWFGNLVTMKWWDELWLNEGFAAYFGFLGAAMIDEEWKMEEQVVEYIDGYMNTECYDSVGLNNSIIKPFESTSEIKDYLRRVVYAKGAALVRMMHKMLGDSAFRRGLMEYLKKNAFKNVNQDDLWQSLTWAQLDSTPIDMKNLMEPWTRQPYYPLITVTRNYRDHEATVEQTSCTNAFGTESKDLWPVPITWIDGTRADYRNTTVKLILDSEKGIIRRLPGKEAWILVNVDRLGYFRVNYDENNWELLLWQLRHNYKVIPTLNRRQLILDAVYFAKINQLPHIIALDVLTYYPFEKEEIVMKALLDDSAIHYYGNMVKYTIAEVYWKEFVHYLFKPIFIRYSRIWEEKDEYGTTSFAWEAAGILCYEGYVPCLLEARNKFKDLFNRNASQNSLDYNMHEDILCALARYSTNEEWNNMIQKYKSNNQYDGSSFLACTEDDQLFRRWAKDYLLLAEERPLKISIRLSDERWKHVIDYLRTHWDEIKKGRREEIMNGLIRQPHNKETLRMLTGLYESRKNEFSKEFQENMDSYISDVTRLIPSSDAIIGVAAWLTSRSWEDIDIREID